MAAMDFWVGEGLVGKVLNYKEIKKSQKIISTSLTGSVYAQQTGDAIVKYEVDVYVATVPNRYSVNQAATDCYEVKFYKRNGVQYVRGYIENDEIEWKEFVDGHGVGHFTIIEE